MHGFMTIRVLLNPIFESITKFFIKVKPKRRQERSLLVNYWGILVKFGKNFNMEDTLYA